MNELFMLFVAFSGLVWAGMEAAMHYSPMRKDTASPFPPLGVPSDAANPARKIVALCEMLVYFIFSPTNIAQIVNSVVQRISIYVVYLSSWPFSIEMKPSGAMKFKQNAVDAEDHVFPILRSSSLANLPSLSILCPCEFASGRVVVKEFSHKFSGDLRLIFNHIFDYRTLS